MSQRLDDIPEETPSRLSYLAGGPMPRPSVAHLGQALHRAAEATGSGGVSYVQEDGTALQRSYAELLDDAARILHGARTQGAVPGDQIVLQIAAQPDLVAVFWACQLGGFVPVPVATRPTDKDPASPARLCERVWEFLGRPYTITDGDPSRYTAGAAWQTRSLGTPAQLRQLPADRDWHDSDWDSIAMLLLTSGSTGLPKAVALTHGNVLSRSAATAATNGLTALDCSFNWMPLDHIGGLVMFHVRDVFLACRQVHASTDWILADPMRWLDSIDRFRCTSTWAPNFAFGLVNDRAERLPEYSWDLSCLGYIMNGGESIKPRVARRFLSMLAPFGLPPTAMYPGWGMSETSAGVVDCQFSLADTTDDDRYVPVGRPHPGVRLRVVDERGQVLPEGTVGRLEVAGDTVTRGYYHNPEQNRQSFTPDGWFKTGDLAFVQAGVLTVTGRIDDVVIIDGISYYGHEIEAAVEELAFVEPSFTVACEVTDPADGVERLAVFCHLRSVADQAAAAAQIKERVAARFGVSTVYVVPVERAEVPKTGIGKLRRTQLRQRFETGAALASARQP